MAGYSSTPLINKLGIKDHFKLRFINDPIDFNTLLGVLPENVTFPESGPYDFVQLFTNSIEELESYLPKLQEQIQSNGMIWVSWFKKASKKNSEINEDIIRNTALALKLVDVKVCSIDQDWSALKLVIRKDVRIK